MYKFKLKPDQMERIEAVRQGPKWGPDVAIRVAESKEVAREEDRVDMTPIKVYTDGSGYEGQIGVAQSSTEMGS